MGTWVRSTGVNTGPTAIFDHRGGNARQNEKNWQNFAEIDGNTIYVKADVGSIEIVDYDKKKAYAFDLSRCTNLQRIEVQYCFDAVPTFRNVPASVREVIVNGTASDVSGGLQDLVDQLSGCSGLYLLAIGLIPEFPRVVAAGLGRLPPRCVHLRISGVRILENAVVPANAETVKLASGACGTTIPNMWGRAHMHRVEIANEPHLEVIDGKKLPRQVESLVVTGCAKPVALIGMDGASVRDLELASLPEVTLTKFSIPKNLECLTLREIGKLTINELLVLPETTKQIVCDGDDEVNRVLATNLFATNDGVKITVLGNFFYRQAALQNQLRAQAAMYNASPSLPASIIYNVVKTSGNWRGSGR